MTVGRVDTERQFQLVSHPLRSHGSIDTNSWGKQTFGVWIEEHVTGTTAHVVLQRITDGGWSFDQNDRQPFVDTHTDLFDISYTYIHSHYWVQHAAWKQKEQRLNYIVTRCDESCTKFGSSSICSKSPRRVGVLWPSLERGGIEGKADSTV